MQEVSYCWACGEPFIPNPRNVDRQILCGKPECVQARKTYNKRLYRKRNRNHWKGNDARRGPRTQDELRMYGELNGLKCLKCGKKLRGNWKRHCPVCHLANVGYEKQNIEGELLYETPVVLTKEDKRKIEQWAAEASNTSPEERILLWGHQ